MRRYLAAAGLCLLAAACSSNQIATAGKVVAEGQLVCAVGPTVVAMVSPSGAAILAKGQTAAYVAAVCKEINGIAVSPPGTPVPTVTVPVPTLS